MGIMKFFERKVLCFEKELLPFKKFHYTNSTTSIVQKLHFTNVMKKVPKTRLKICIMGNMGKSRFTHSTEFWVKKKRSQFPSKQEKSISEEITPFLTHVFMIFIFFVRMLHFLLPHIVVPSNYHFSSL